jgi:cytochrome c2
MRAERVAAACIAAMIVWGCVAQPPKVAAGVAGVTRYGCGSCHTIPGVPGADGRVGPSLASFGKQQYVAGELNNTPDNLIRWIQHPRSVNEKTVMPELGVTAEDARNISILLYSLK